MVKPQTQTVINKKNRSGLIGLFIAVATVIAILYITTTSFIMTHAPWETTIDGVNVGGIPIDSINNQLPTKPVAFQLQVSSPTNNYQFSARELKISKNYARVLDTIHATLASPVSAWRWWVLAIKNPTNFQSSLMADQSSLEKLVSRIANQEQIEGRSPRITLNRSNDLKSLVVDPGENGFQVDQTKALELIQFALSQNQTQVELPLLATIIALTPQQTESWLKQAGGLVGKSLTFTLPDQPITYQLKDTQLIDFLNVNATMAAQSSQLVTINRNQIDRLVKEWSHKINRPPQNPVLDVDQTTLWVNNFVPPLDGLVVDNNMLSQSISSFIRQNLSNNSNDQTFLINESALDQEYLNDQRQISAQNSTYQNVEPLPPILPLPLITQPPSISLANTNSLGVNEKIGHGQSRYTGSIATRIHNVSLATSRVNLIILRPGQEFSFNDQLGEVSAASGFKPAYIIRSGRTELGDGGGVCQVSTTLFRAALDAGLKITKRLPHSYRVSYYELDTKPGIDATVFAGEVDLRFVNDTPGHILIYGQADPKTLSMYYDIYGTNDGRVATISDHVTWAATPPLPPEYIYDPSLAPGQRKQIDWSTPGLKAKFTYTVVDQSGKELHKQTFTSSYRPWSAKYLVGTPPETN